MPVSEAHGVVRVRLLPWPSCLPDEQNHAFVTDSDPRGSESGSEGIPGSFFQDGSPGKSQIPLKLMKWVEQIWDFRKHQRNFAKIGGIPENRPKSPEIV